MRRLQPTDALIVVDVQNDFCSGGTLAVPGGDEVIPVLNRWIAAAQQGGAAIVASRDWHPPDHISFRDQGGPWPAHCIQNTWGAQFHSDLNLPDGVQIVSKAQERNADAYSDFQGTDLAANLKQKGIRRLWVGGLAQDYCVRATVLDGIDAGFEVHLIKNATRPVDAVPGDGARAIEDMRAAGCHIDEELDRA
jgi:nicotinamidase/pyrazinamidase